MRSLAAVLGILFLPFHVQAETPLPWKAGEVLNYEIHWGMFVAAEARFQAEPLGVEQWSFRLDLTSRGVVETFYPIRSAFVSTLDPDPWRSLGFQAGRQEGGRNKEYRVAILYPENEGRFENITDKTSTSFQVPHPAVDDLLSMLYAVRRHPWEAGRTLRFHVYEDRNIKEGLVERMREVSIADRTGADRECWLLEGKETGEVGDKKRVVSRIWLTRDEQRIPIRAECQARFGTFRMTLVP